MKNLNIFLFALFMAPLLSFSQSKVKDSIEDKPERPAFLSAMLIDNQTNVLNHKNTLELMMQHRFGYISETNSLAGIYGANTNIRLAVAYSPLKWLQVGYGITKKNRMSDFNLKVGLLKQTRSDKIPLSITYYANAVIDGRSGSANDDIFVTRQDRYSYFHQVIFARRFNKNLSLQIAPSLSHFNTVDYGYKNDRFAIAFGGRYRVSSQTAILIDYSLPITALDIEGQTGPSFDHSGLSLGFEFGTIGHAFQIFVTNLNGIVPQQNYMKNTNVFSTDNIMIGFNITRLYYDLFEVFK